MWCIKSPSTTYNYITTSVTTTSLHHNHVPTLVSTATLRDQRENHGEDSTTPFSGLGTVEKIQGDTQALNPIGALPSPSLQQRGVQLGVLCSSAVSPTLGALRSLFAAVAQLPMVTLARVLNLLAHLVLW